MQKISYVVDIKMYYFKIYFQINITVRYIKIHSIYFTDKQGKRVRSGLSK